MDGGGCNLLLYVSGEASKLVNFLILNNYEFRPRRERATSQIKLAMAKRGKQARRVDSFCREKRKKRVEEREHACSTTVHGGLIANSDASDAFPGDVQ